MQLTDLKWPDIAALSRDVPVVIPIAALEQHGRHMPLFTDSLLLGEVIRRVSERLKDRILFTPLMWLGNSEHHLDFPGTMTAAPRVYLDLLKAMVELRQKYRQRGDLLLLSTTYWTLGTKPREKDHSFVQDAMGHACEWETSMML